MITETIQWHPVSEPPDDDVTVLLCSPFMDEVEEAHLSASTWYLTSGLPLGPQKFVTGYWAHKPNGPSLKEAA